MNLVIDKTARDKEFESWWRTYGRELARPIDGLINAEDGELIARAAWSAAWRTRGQHEPTA